MRKTLVIVALTLITVMASASDAFAQGRGGRGGRGGYGGGRGGYGGGGYGGIFIGSGYYSPYSYGGGYYSPYSYGSGYYADPYYNSSPSYYSDTVQVPATDIRQSLYNQPTSQQQTATVMVRVATPNTQVWFDGTATSQQGMERSFYSPPLDSGSSYTYTVRARWTENGQAVDREQRVSVQAGQTANVDFRGNSNQALPLPKRQ
jgi:uncharacterized protein (TIGR03000 family)